MRTVSDAGSHKRTDVSNMKGMTLKKIAEAVGGKLCPNGAADAGGYPCAADSIACTGGDTFSAAEAEAVVIDSRKVTLGAVFVATKGERSDGHDYIAQVFKNGAFGVICERIPEGVTGPCILVEDSFTALRKLAEYYRVQMSEVKIVGIVGSVGKTSTKELVASVLEQSFNTLKTEGNLNNEIGVPLTILRLRSEHEAAVVEMGINHFGEMDRLGQIVKPDAVVMTNIGPCHLEFLQDLDGVLRAKSEVFKHIRKGGVLILNAEDEKLSTVPDVPGIRILRYGQGGEIYARDVKNLGLEGSEADICFTDQNGSTGVFHASIKLPGTHMILNSLAATAAGMTFGMSTDKIREGLLAAKPVSGRSNLIRTGKYLIVDDCYNANPKADCAAVDMMSGALGRKVAILGDMFELGEDAPKLHAQVGEYAAGHGIDFMVCVGELSRHMYESALKTNSSMGLRYFESLEALLDNIGTIGLEDGDTILVKASHGMKFTQIVEKLKAL